ncbi:E3 SUMO-protein ligase NSE2-like [Sitodiplosis mosellana]|uniref:E3 SUMO-protein ligase NSE2-like n=1 Tax=Sitodiplosis mosellana TaxID=263140 RepID=UPI00244474BE|nr:E3 SUMO-protein ligase NSE2-like [Sitodiplosis mosellana]
MNGISHGDNILKSLHNTLDIALKYGDAVDADVEKYKEMAKSVCKIEHGFLLGHDIVKEAAKQGSVETFDQVLEDHRDESHPKFKPQTSKRYTDFVKKAQRLVDVERDDASQASQDVDMTIDLDSSQVQEHIPDIDPITKQKLERPVRNKHCNHIYGFNSVQQSIQQNARLRCPIVGCPNKKHVQMSDLIEDEELATRLAKQRKTQR